MCSAAQLRNDSKRKLTLPMNGTANALFVLIAYYAAKTLQRRCT